MRHILRFFGFLMAWASLGAVFAMIAVAGVVYIYSRDLPDTSALAAYEPITLSRVYSGEGALMDEYARERRIFTPADEIPDLVKEAFISAEDKNFYTHLGFDPRGIAAAVFEALQGQRPRGASTITQQVAKNFLLSGEREIERKIKEIILAVELERTLSKEQILELYLNEIFLGQNAYGVTAAAQNYFSKTLEELTPGEAAYLAALPKAPSDLHPVRERDAAEGRRNYVLREMYENGYITEEVELAAQEAPLRTVQSGDIPSARREVPPRGYFTEEIRRQLSARFGEDKLFGGGLTVRATIDRDLQDDVEAALRKKLESWDRDHGKWRGPLDTIDPALLDDEDAWRGALAGKWLPRDIDGWRLAVVLELGDSSARVGIEGVPDDEDGHFLTLKDAAWTGAGKPSDLWAPGDIVLVREITDDEGKFVRWSLRQIPELQGAVMAMDPSTGRVLAMQGGFSYQASVFNRATQATRQPGSSFKPFVYAAALDHGYNPATIVLDAPVTVQTGAGAWKPMNSSRQFYGPSPLRIGIENSRNVMTVRLAQDIGMDSVAEYAERFGVYDNMPHHLAYALGAGETTLWKMVAAYGMFANGGLRLEPTLVDRVQDRRGRTIYRHDQRECDACNETTHTAGEPEPWVIDRSERVMDPITAYQLTSMMEGVVQRGTATVLNDLGLHLAAKTGTTNDAKDAWLISFSPNLVVGCFIGYDTPRPMGRGAYGGTMCGPVVHDVLAEAKKTISNPDFKVPESAVAVKMDRRTGIRQPDDASGPNIVTEMFRRGEEPQVYAAADMVIGEGNFTFGSDLPLSINEEGDYAPQPGNQGGQGGQGAGAPPPPPAGQLGVGSGGLY
ncbi:PBP1A family penicillin-binding protein [Oceanicella sp. SM1341]|uniref:penicillin-binding protein 1A n=1 Tax=Oceanicella sp. SM1341 TaxID=1548889 RepID=UPI000E4D6365